MPDAFPIFPKTPLATGTAETDIPTLTPYIVSSAKGPTPAFVVLPGGGYGMLAPHEGPDIALWLNTLGISAFVLKYRLGSAGYRHPAMLLDAARAMRVVRARAKEFNIDPNRVAIKGSSAGGHLASTVCVHYDHPHSRQQNPDAIDQLSARPDAALLLYPVLSFVPPFWHKGTHDNLLGVGSFPELEEMLTNYNHINAQTPPSFIFQTTDDQAVPVENTLRWVEACHKHKVSVEAHIYETGAHGLGLSYTHAPTHSWPDLAALWLRRRGF